MNRAEALAHFEEEYSKKAVVNMRKAVIAYLMENQQKLTATFVENFRELCKKIRLMQNEGKKGKIAYITYSYGVENIQMLSREYIVQAYGEEWFYEDGEECKIPYSVDYAYKFIDTMYNELLEISKKYIGNITIADLHEVWHKAVNVCDAKLLAFAKKAIKEAVEIDEFKSIDIEEVIEIRFGQYKGYNEIIHKIDTRIKDSKEMKEWLESEEKSYSDAVLKNLDLSNGNYKGIIAQRSDFSGSDLSNSTFEGACLIEAVFIKSVINGVNFKEAELPEGKIQDTVIKNANFEDANLMDGNLSASEFVGCNLTNVLFSGADLSNCRFMRCMLEKAVFFEANLNNANFQGNILKNAEFIETILDEANLSDTDMTGATFINIDFTTFKFDNAIFKDNVIKKVKIFKKDLKQFNLTEEQRKEVTIVG